MNDFRTLDGIPTYVVGLLFLANLFNLIDRAIIGIVTEPLKHDLALTDTQMSLVSGAAFVLFHLIAGISIARWADRGNRRLILVLGIAIWSTATGLTGYTQGSGRWRSPGYSSAWAKRRYFRSRCR